VSGISRAGAPPPPRTAAQSGHCSGRRGLTVDGDVMLGGGGASP
jgi:hypothetical protein